VQQDPKIVSMKKHLSLLNPNYIPPPLRMARNRHLRHWTIHRAWMLFQRQQKEDRERELMRMYQGMHLACEELRLTEGPGTREEGYLYRVAMEKKGVYGAHGVPIEYARMQTETPAREAWKHDWKRPDDAKA
jgi:large subunit ribosomal protein L40